MEIRCQASNILLFRFSVLTEGQKQNNQSLTPLRRRGFAGYAFDLRL